MARHVVVLGGGISGLTAAYAIKQAASGPLRVSVIESSHRLGGWIHSQRKDGLLFESGPRGLRPVGKGRMSLSLVEQLGLQRNTLVSSPAASNRYIWHAGQLIALPSNPAGALTHPLIRRVIIDTIRRDLLGQGAPSKSELDSKSASATTLPVDETVHSFALRHFGPTTANVLLDAVLSGIYAGDVKSMSARSVLSFLWTHERSPAAGPRGSIIRSVLASARRNAASAISEGASKQTARLRHRYGRGPPLPSPGPLHSAFVNACAKSSSVSFLDGLEELPRAMAKALTAPAVFSNGATVELLRGTAVTSLAPVADGSGVKLVIKPSGSSNSSTEETSLVASEVISALPAFALADVLAGTSPSSNNNNKDISAAVSALRGIPFASVATVNLGYRRHVMPAGLAGFGYLIPSTDRIWKADPHAGSSSSSNAAFAAMAGNIGHSNSNASSAHSTSTTGVVGSSNSASTASSTSATSTGVLGMTWDSDVFPGQSQGFVERVHGRRMQPRRDKESGSLLPWTAGEVPASLLHSETRVTVMIGGATFPHDVLAGMSETQLLAIALRAAREHLGITVAPDVTSVNKALNAIPQYTVGHADRVKAVMDGCDKALFGRLHVIGNSFQGIGLSDCIDLAVTTGRSVAQQV